MKHTRRSVTLIRLLITSGILVGLSVGFAHAQAPGPQLIPDTGMIGDCNFITGEIHFDCIPLYVAYVTRLVFGMAGGFALLEIIRGGYEYSVSGLQSVVGGLPDKEAAKKRITTAILGLCVVVLAYVIVDMIVSVIFGS